MRPAAAFVAAVLLASGCLGAESQSFHERLTQGDVSISALLGGGQGRLVLHVDGPDRTQALLARLEPASGGLRLTSHGERILIPGARLPATLAEGALDLGTHQLSLPAAGDEVDIVGNAARHRVTFATLSSFEPEGELGAFVLGAPALAWGETELAPDAHALLAVRRTATGVSLELAGAGLSLPGATIVGDPLAGGAEVRDASGDVLFALTAVESAAGGAALLEGPAMGALAPGAQSLGLLVARGEGDARVALLAVGRPPFPLHLVDARTGRILAHLGPGARVFGASATDLTVSLDGTDGSVARATTATSQLDFGPPSGAGGWVLWEPTSGAFAVITERAADDIVGGLGLASDDPGLAFDLGIVQGLAEHLPDDIEPEGGVAEVLELVGGLQLPLAGDPPSSQPGLRVGASEPFDPEGPWTVGALRVVVTSGVHDDITLSGPLVLRMRSGVLDEVIIVNPAGERFATLSCARGACKLATPIETHTLPAGTLAVEGDWQRGRPTGLRLDALDGEAVLRVALFGRHGVRATGSGLDHPITMSGPLVLEGDPRDPDRVAVVTPSGDRLLDVRPGGTGLGTLTIVGHAVAADVVGATLHGDPLTEDEVTLVVSADGEPVPFDIPLAAADTFADVADRNADVLVLRSPLRLEPGHLLLAAGPVVLEGAGALSPRFDVLVRLAVANATGYDRASLLLDGDFVAELRPSGMEAEDVVFHGLVPSWQLPPEHGASVVLTLRLARDLAPGLSHVQTTAGFALGFDSEGPPAPTPVVEDDVVAWEPVPGADEYEAEAGPEGETPQPVAVNGTHADLPSGEPGQWRARIRSVDAVGNPGPWSPDVTWVEDEPPSAGVQEPRLQVTSPESGVEVSGIVLIQWTADATIALVSVDATNDGGLTWVRVGRAPTPPIEWDTRLVRDGVYILRVTAEGSGGSRGELISDIEVDNLDPLAPVLGPSDPAELWGAGDGEAEASPRTSSPLPVALLYLLGLSASGGLAWHVLRRKASPK